MPKRNHSTDLEGHLGYWLRFVSNHVSSAFARKLEARGTTTAEWVLLRQLLETQPVPPSHLAGRLGTTRGTVSKLSERLIAKGLVQRTPDPQDRRAHTLALTPQGRKLIPELARLADRNDDEFFGHLSEKEKDALLHALRGIVAHHRLSVVPVD